MKIVLVGAGNLATNFGKGLKAIGEQVVQIYSRTEASARSLSELLQCSYTTEISDICKDADIYIYALKDSVLQEIAQQTEGEDAIHLHTAGSMDMNVLQHKKHYGVFYPLQTFSKDRIVDFKSIPIFVESNDAYSLETTMQLAHKLSEKVYRADSEQRRKMHLAAVFACNFVNCMYANAAEITASAGIPFDVLHALIDETAAKIHQLSPAKAQTGPAVRMDKNVIDKHISDLSNERQQMIYKLLSEDIYKRKQQEV